MPSNPAFRPSENVSVDFEITHNYEDAVRAMYENLRWSPSAHKGITKMLLAGPPVLSTADAMSKAKWLTSEEWREYDYSGRVVRINNPQRLWIGNSHHYVLDANNVVHCVPAPGFHACELRWKSKPGNAPVSFI